MLTIVTKLSLRFQVAMGKYHKKQGGDQTASSSGCFWFYFSSFFLWTYRGATFIVAGEIPGLLLLMTALLLVSRKLSTFLCLNCSLSLRDGSLWPLYFSIIGHSGGWTVTMGPGTIPMDYTNMGSNNALDRNAPTISSVLDTLITNNHGVINDSSTQ